MCGLPCAPIVSGRWSSANKMRTFGGRAFMDPATTRHAISAAILNVIAGLKRNDETRRPTRRETTRGACLTRWAWHA